jgi:hypothetical protein
MCLFSSNAVKLKKKGSDMIRHALATALLFSSISAHADFYQYDTTVSPGGQAGDPINRLVTTYDPLTEWFTWDVSYENGQSMDAFWLVINNGPNPKSSDTNELAITYGDITTGLASTYVYNGQNSSSSIRSPAIWLEDHSITTSSTGFSFSFDATNINNWSSNPHYTGIQFDHDIGIWFHIAEKANIVYNGNTLTDFNIASGDHGWYDVSNRQATLVEFSPPRNAQDVNAAPVFIGFAACALLLIGRILRRGGVTHTSLA